METFNEARTFALEEIAKAYIGTLKCQLETDIEQMLEEAEEARDGEKAIEAEQLRVEIEAEIVKIEKVLKS